MTATSESKRADPLLQVASSAEQQEVKRIIQAETILGLGFCRKMTKKSQTKLKSETKLTSLTI